MEWNENKIELKNINLEGITIMDQLAKVSEEKAEFIIAVIKRDSTNAVEEFFDLMQAGLGALDKMGLDAEYVMAQYYKHLEKIKSRPRRKAAIVNQDFEAAIQDMVNSH